MRKEIITHWRDYNYTCDVCGNIAYKTCRMCGGDLCNCHTIYDPRDHGDYPNTYCEYCWDIGEEFRDEMDKTQEIFDQEMGKLEDAWRRKAVDK